MAGKQKESEEGRKFTADIESYIKECVDAATEEMQKENALPSAKLTIPSSHRGGEKRKHVSDSSDGDVTDDDDDQGLDDDDCEKGSSEGARSDSGAVESKRKKRNKPKGKGRMNKARSKNKAKNKVGKLSKHFSQELSIVN